MRKFLVFLVTTCLLFFMSLPTQAAYYTLSISQLAGMGHTFDAVNTTSYPLTVTNNGTSIEYVQRLKYGNGTIDGFASAGIGYGWPPPPEMQDLSAYDGFQLTLTNVNNSQWFVNVYLNTGWTSPPYGEQDNFYQGSWIAIVPGVSTTVALDFAALGVINRNHVTNIGFEIGGNMDAYPINDPLNPSNPDSFHILVSPEPATMALLGLGALLLRGKSKR